jgi:hypothetical protein
VNVEGETALRDQGICSAGGRSAEATAAIRARIQYELADINNEPDKLVSRGELTVPLLHTWSRADPNVCGAAPTSCPRRDGTTVTLSAADCIHEPLRAAIAGLGAGSRSRNLRVCVSPASAPGSCATHVVTNKDTLNTDPAEPADYNAAILDWVHARLGDP